jgi:NAD(P)-dependent dehydrogenase (short-subunit alcohol dehydrogenase family)
MDKQTLLIAGGTGNIGGGAAVSLARRGAKVVLLGHRLDHLETKAKYFHNILSEDGIKDDDIDIETLLIDFSDMQSVRNSATEALKRFPKIHGIIFTVGTIVQNGPTILSGGHEIMFATNVLGPFLFTKLLSDRLQQSNGLVLHIINPTKIEIDWDDLESIKNHKTGVAFERTKMMNRIFAGELARRYNGKISSIAYYPSLIIDKNDPELKKRWPKGFMGFAWKVMTILIAKPPKVAGEPIADLYLSYENRNEINGAYFKLNRRKQKGDRVMDDEEMGKRFWKELEKLTI